MWPRAASLWPKQILHGYGTVSATTPNSVSSKLTKTSLGIKILLLIDLKYSPRFAGCHDLKVRLLFQWFQTHPLIRDVWFFRKNVKTNVFYWLSRTILGPVFKSFGA